MTLNEMKESAKQLTPEELEDLALHVEFLRQCADPAWRAEIRRRVSGSGKWHSAEELKVMDERLTAEGR